MPDNLIRGDTTMTGTHGVHGVMDAGEYDALISSIVPGQQSMLGIMTDYLPSHPRRILELGCGTGILTAMVRELYPDAEITGIDISAEMLDMASSKPALHGVVFLVQDLRDAWPEGSFDAILTSFCLHHVPVKDRVMVARRAARVLSPGGRFICADVFRSEHDWEENMQREIWCRGMEQGGASYDVIRGMIAQREKNIPGFTTVFWFRDMLREAGFTRATVPFISGFFGLVAGEVAVPPMMEGSSRS